LALGNERFKIHKETEYLGKGIVNSLLIGLIDAGMAASEFDGLLKGEENIDKLA
jgi:hypothetical protein